MPSPARRRALAALAFLLPTGLVAQTVPALTSPAALTPYQSLGRDLLRELVETNTTYSVGSTTPVAFDVDAAEKVFHSVRLTVRNPGGHSSLPSKDNAIYRLAAALGRLGTYDFPFQTNAITRAYFARSAALNEGPLAAEVRAVSAGGEMRACDTRRPRCDVAPVRWLRLRGVRPPS